MEGLDKFLAAAEGMVNAEQEANADKKNIMAVNPVNTLCMTQLLLTNLKDKLKGSFPLTHH